MSARAAEFHRRWQRLAARRSLRFTRRSAVAGSGAEESAAQRLARLSRWCSTGRVTAAELELYEWRRTDDCPAEAVALLAGLLARSNGYAAAVDVLEERLVKAGENDPIILQSLIALHAKMNDARGPKLIARLHREHGHCPAVMRWLRTLCGPRGALLPPVSGATIDQLAGELLDNTDVIPSLVAAQRIDRDKRTIAMLRGAVTQMLRDVSDEGAMIVACQALADLALLVDDHDDARRWAHRGLRLDPYAAQLAMVLSRVKDDPAIGPPASTILQGVVKAHPRYPDVRAALIRREFAEGRVEVARRRLNQWLQREPNQPTAIRLQTELAA